MSSTKPDDVPERSNHVQYCWLDGRRVCEPLCVAYNKAGGSTCQVLRVGERLVRHFSPSFPVVAPPKARL